jgi:hypothetical protein
LSNLSLTHTCRPPWAPSDLDGIPTVDNRSSWFFPYSDTRQPVAIADLWRIAQQSLASGIADVNPELFERCARIGSVRIAKLTMGLYWFAPNDFLSVDSRTQQYLTYAYGLTKTVTGYEPYRTFLGEVRTLVPDDFSQIVYYGFVMRPDAPKNWAGGFLPP